jgi:enamine deaminase RidA (YjgF/YER057c/UK114 family)
MTTKERFHLRPEGEKAFGYAQAVKAGNWLHISGSLSVDDSFAPLAPGDMSAQIANVYDAIARTLAAHGLGFGDIVKETIFVTDMNAYLAANPRRITAYGGALPAATAVEVKRLAFPECLVEIEALAAF